MRKGHPYGTPLFGVVVSLCIIWFCTVPTHPHTAGARSEHKFWKLLACNWLASFVELCPPDDVPTPRFQSDYVDFGRTPLNVLFGRVRFTVFGERSVTRAGAVNGMQIADLSEFHRRVVRASFQHVVGMEIPILHLCHLQCRNKGIEELPTVDLVTIPSHRSLLSKSANSDLVHSLFRDTP